MKDMEISDAIRSAGLELGSKVLDIGCGDGLLLDRVSETYPAQGYGIDVSQNSLLRATAECMDGFRLARSDGRQLPFKDDYFDLVLSMDVLEHIERPELVVREAARVLRSSGTVVCYAVSSMNRYTFNWFLVKAMDALGVDHWGHSAHEPGLLVDPSELCEALNQAGFEITSLSPFHACFTIVFDQSLLSVFWLISKFGLKNSSSDWEEGIWRKMIEASTSICRILRPVLNRLDSPWTTRGLSNGFLVIAKKSPVTRPALP